MQRGVNDSTILTHFISLRSGLNVLSSCLAPERMQTFTGWIRVPNFPCLFVFMTYVFVLDGVPLNSACTNLVPVSPHKVSC